MEPSDARTLIELHNNAVHSLDAALMSLRSQDDQLTAASNVQSVFENILKAIVVIAERFDKEDRDKSKPL